MEILIGIISFIFGFIVSDKYRALKIKPVTEDDSIKRQREREEAQWQELFSYTEEKAVR